MGKAADRRMASQAKYLAQLAATDPEQFYMEWEKRMDTWLYEIRMRVNNFSNGNADQMKPAFEVVKKATRLWKEIGLKSDLKDYCSINVLTTECCKGIAMHIDPRLYRLSVNLRRR